MHRLSWFLCLFLAAVPTTPANAAIMCAALWFEGWLPVLPLRVWSRRVIIREGKAPSAEKLLLSRKVETPKVLAASSTLEVLCVSG